MNLSVTVPISLTAELIARFARQGIAALEAHGAIFGHSFSATHLIIDAADAEAVNEVLAAFRADFADTATTSNCKVCAYDLKGHIGKDDCPECGEPVNAESPDVDCDGCGEPVPLHFEACWNCDKSLEGMEDP